MILPLTVEAVSTTGVKCLVFLNLKSRILGSCLCCFSGGSKAVSAKELCAGFFFDESEPPENIFSVSPEAAVERLHREVRRCQLYVERNGSLFSED